MTLEQFAKKAGIIIVPCHPEWGGRIAYTTKGSNSRVCGFKTKEAAYKHWLDNEFSNNKIGKMVLKALKVNPL